jgi:hypothetical protein
MIIGDALSVLRDIDSRAWQLRDVDCDKECLVAREQLALDRRPDSFSK